MAQMALVEAAGKFRVGSCPFGAFAYREVRTAVLMELRRLRVRFRGRAEMPEHVDLQPEAAHRLELYDALAALPPRQYQAVMLTYWGGNRSIAVSYTHLDVYKRQAMKRVRMLGSWDAIGGLRTEKGVA